MLKRTYLFFRNFLLLSKSLLNTTYFYHLYKLQLKAWTQVEIQYIRQCQYSIDIPLHNRYTLYEKCILTCANYGPLVDVCDDTQENIKKYLQIDDELIKGLRKIIEVNVPKEELMRFALSHKCKGGAHQIYPGQHYNLMKQDQYEKERLINELEGETLEKIEHDEDNEANSRQRKLARTFLSKTRQDGVDYENKFGTYDEITPRIAYTLQNYRRQLPNEAFRYLTNTRFVKEKEDLIPTQCPNCGGKNSPYHETNCKKAQEYHIGVHDKIVDHIEQVLRQYKAVKVSKENHNRLYEGPSAWVLKNVDFRCENHSIILLFTYILRERHTYFRFNYFVSQNIQLIF
ncbi:Reverse_transcriptase (RNA-dependent DNA polymerase) [Hexamita inflata]|uniref:Reverse transcriptase (RNA-dependent DNA polymerase) n=1 Tax=Hexamita inflata TaxID=28002 RepID=A0AA86QPS9_9EUKA|nr:Reverse transcriptase (RNA-dependent DNA polymerase) [Hexamita inflata]